MRNFERHKLKSHALLQTEIESKNNRIQICDYSRMGIGFLTHQKIELRSFVSVMYQNENNQIIQMKSFVKHLRQIDENSFFVGVQFVGIESKFNKKIY